jgi:hypothetical protein
MFSNGALPSKEKGSDYFWSLYVYWGVTLLVLLTDLKLS